MSKPLILVDGSSYLYRAYHALPLLTNSKGQATGAVYGVINMLRKLIKEYEPDHFAVIFDAKGKTFRDELYADYKATREATPDALIEQIEPLHEIIRAMGIPLIIIEGVEADDVIGTLAHAAEKQGMQTLISTGDKDFAQLVTPNITLINTMTNSILNRENVIAKFGVPPETIIDYLTLVGDTSDNIKGVPQVGPKTAAKWLTQYGSLHNLLTHADEIKGKVGDNFRAFIKDIPLTRELVTIKLDVPLPLSSNDFLIKQPDHTKLITLFREMEFKTWISDLLEKNKDTSTINHKKYPIILDESALLTLTSILEKCKVFVVDTETTSLNYMQAKIVGLAICLESHDAYYIPFGHDYDGAPAQLSEEKVLTALKPIFENEKIKKIGHHIKYDIEVLLNHGITLKGAAFDTMLESYILNSTGSRHDLDTLALKYLGWRTITFEDIAGKGEKQLTFNQIELEKAATYAAEDADVTLRLHQTLWPTLKIENGLLHVFNNIEIPLINVLARMERHGVLIDPDNLKKQGEEMAQRLIQCEREAFLLAGRAFNLSSPKQLQEILFDQLKLPILQKTPGGQASTADSILQELALDYALPKIIIEHRKLSKLISTYTNRLVEQINLDTKRVHTSYHQAGTATGRLSSSEPNLQNIPTRTLEGKRIRQAFIAPPHYKLISADYSQIELRLMAHISQDRTLIKSFEQNLDIHRATAAEVWDVPITEVTSEMRRHAKAINFGLLYGMSAFGLSKQIGTDRKTADLYIERYFKRYPGVQQYMEKTKLHAKQFGYVETLFGRRLYLPDINASQIPRQRAAERTAINAPLQGSSADLIKMAMINIDRWLQESDLDAHMIMQVHDELVIEAHDNIVDAVAIEVSKQMTEVVSLCVPLLVSIGIGQNWDAASHE